MPPSNPLPGWLAQLALTATGWELLAATIGFVAVCFALLSTVDNVFDLRYVRREAVVGGPRWITATYLLAANVLFLLCWLGYLHVAVTAVYLPPRPDMDAGTLNEVAVMRIGYGAFGLAAQVALRLMRTRLRGLSREQWAPLFGETERWRERALTAEGRYHAARAEVAEQRVRAHTALNREAGHVLRIGVLERLLAQHGIAYPPRVAVSDDAPPAEKE